MSNDTSQNGKKKQKQNFSLVCDNLSTFIQGKKPGTFVFSSFKFPHKFHKHSLERGKYAVLEEAEGQEVKYVGPDAVAEELLRFTADLPHEMEDYKLDAEKANKVRNYWLYHMNNFTHEIKPVLQKSEPGWTFKRLDFDMKDEPTPIFDDFLSRIETNTDAFLAYNGMLFDPTAPRQQYLWLMGPGGDGKGSWCRFLGKIFGEEASASLTAMKDMGKDKFFTSRFIGKRVATFPDCHYPRFVQEEIFMSLSGGDNIYCEFKHGHGYTTKLTTLFVFASNFLPEISSSQSNMRRAIICTMRGRDTEEKADPAYEDNLWKERAGIIYKCCEAWKRHKAENGYVIVDKLVAEMVAEESEERWESIFEQYFVPTTNEKEGVRACVISDLLRIHAKLTKFESERFKQYIHRKYGIEGKRIKNGSVAGPRIYIKVALNETAQRKIEESHHSLPNY